MKEEEEEELFSGAEKKRCVWTVTVNEWVYIGLLPAQSRHFGLFRTSLLLQVAGSIPGTIGP